MKLKWLDEYCNCCGNQLNSWDKKISRALRYQNAVCESCVAKEYDMDVDALRRRMEHYLGLRPCQGI